MRDGQVVELIRQQLANMQAWCTERFSGLRDEDVRLKDSLADAHNLAVHTNLRVQAVVQCIANPERYFIRGWRVPLLWKSLTPDYVEGAYQRLLSDLMRDLRAREEKKQAEAKESRPAENTGTERTEARQPEAVPA